MRQKLTWALVSLSAITPAYALEGSLEQAEPSELIQACVDGLAVGEDVSAVADALRLRDNLNLSESVRRDGIRCLRTHFNEHFYFIAGSYISHEERRAEQRIVEAEQSAEREERLRRDREAQLRREEEARQAREAQAVLEAQREAELAENRAEYYRRYYAACYDELRRHAFAALNEPQCVEIFLHNGFDG